MSTTPVYRYRQYNIVTDEKPIARRLATAAAIERMKVERLEPLFDAASHLVDRDGFYTPSD